MAWFDDPWGEQWAEGLDWSPTEQNLFADMAEHAPSMFDDALLQQAFDIGWFDFDVAPEYREAAREFVIEWMETEYGIDFDDVFDWAVWRESYEGEG